MSAKAAPGALPAIDFHLRLEPDGRLTVNVPKDATMCLKIVSAFLAHISDYVELKADDHRIVIPKIVLGAHNGR